MTIPAMVPAAGSGLEVAFTFPLGCFLLLAGNPLGLLPLEPLILLALSPLAFSPLTLLAQPLKPLLLSSLPLLAHALHPLLLPLARSPPLLHPDGVVSSSESALSGSSA